MKTVALTTALALLASQATALSCMRPDPIDTFERLAEAPETYFALLGTVTFDESLQPQGTGAFTGPGDPDPIPGTFTGMGLSKDGFVVPYDTDVTVQVTCAGPWCGSTRSGVRAVYFVPAGTTPAALQAEPCGSMIFPDPSPAVLEMLTSCMQGGTCEPLPFE